MAGFAPLLLMIVSAGSRQAELGAAVAVAALFLTVGIAGKMKLIVAVSIALLALAVVIPAQLTKRLFTIFGNDDVTQMDAGVASTIESTEARKVLLMDSIKITFQHPIFGVGPGNFQVEQDKLARARGEENGNWHVTHNTYKQWPACPGYFFFWLLSTIVFDRFHAFCEYRYLPVPRHGRTSTWWRQPCESR
jgi:O-antigen ligase